LQERGLFESATSALAAAGTELASFGVTLTSFVALQTARLIKTVATVFNFLFSFVLFGTFSFTVT